MDDARIVELFWQRDEAALTEAESKYGVYCASIARNILHSPEDAQECVNDALLGAWNAIPPHKPAVLSTFLGKLTRRISLNKWHENTAKKRGGGAIEESLDELAECIPDGHSIDDSLRDEEITRIIDRFLETLPKSDRCIFVRRYWYLDSIGHIAKVYGFSESKVKMTLKRTRDKLKFCLQEEGVLE